SEEMIMKGPSLPLGDDWLCSESPDTSLKRQRRMAFLRWRFRLMTKRAAGRGSVFRMWAVTVGVLAMVLSFAGEVAAVEQETAFAVARVDGKTKRVDGQIYHLVAIGLDPKIQLLGTGLSSPVLVITGADGRLALADGDAERMLEDKIGRYRLMWL